MVQVPAHRTLPAPTNHPPGERGCLFAHRGRCAGASVLFTMFVFASASTTVAAQPVTHPEPAPCSVTFAYAPEAVRTEIEAWVRAEPRCVRSLELRVVPDARGFSLVGRDSDGNVRERVVPDAQAAAVLVVSWIADDTIAPTPVPVAAPVADPVAARAIALPPIPTPPALPRLGDDLGLVRDVPRDERARRRRWLMLGGVAGDGEVGARLALELLVRDRWSLGLSGAWLAAPSRERDPRMSDPGARGRAVVSVTRELALGPVALRAQLGAGVELSTGDAMTGTTVSPLGEAALLVVVPLGASWGLAGGPVVDVSTGAGHTTGSHGVFLGLARRL